MKNVTVYTTEPCNQCILAKELLERHEITYTEVNLGKDPEGRRKLAEKTGYMTFPQIVAGEEVVGGFRELLTLERDEQIETTFS